MLKDVQQYHQQHLHQLQQKLRSEKQQHKIQRSAQC